MLTLALFLLLLGSHAASAQVAVRGNISFGGPPRAYYGPRNYYPSRPAVVYAVPPPVVIAPYYAPRLHYHAPAPRPYYGYGGQGGRGYGRRW